MNLKTVKRITVPACVLTILFIALGSFIKSDLLLWLGLIVAVLTLIFCLIFARCPYCGKYLGRGNEKYCTHCGKKIEW